MSEYEKITINGRTRSAHDVIMERQLDRPLAGNEVVHHINGDKRDNRPENLEVMERGEHTAMHRKGQVFSPQSLSKMRRASKGRQNTLQRKLTEKQVREIVQQLLEGSSLSALSRSYGVSSKTIAGIRNGTLYRDIASAIPGVELPLQVRRKRAPAGQGRRKLSIWEVQLVRVGLLQGESVRSIADRFGVSRTVVIDIRDGSSYTDIPWPEEADRYPFSENVPELVDFLLSHPLSEIEDEIEALKQDYHVYPNPQAVYALKMVRRAVAGDTELGVFLFSMSRYKKEIEHILKENSIVYNYLLSPEK